MRYLIVVALGILVVGAVILAGCGPDVEPAVEKTPSSAHVEPATPSEELATPVSKPEAESEALSARTESALPSSSLWVPGKEGVLIAGLDGGLYEAYLPGVVVKVQEALFTRGLYTGVAHGHLDDETMQSVREFQKQRDLQLCGVPTPRTREALLATDPKR